MLSSLNEKGQACIVCSQGVLFRSGEEGKIRKNMIVGSKENNLKGDVIEGIIALPQKMFWGTSIPACIMVLNKNKPAKRKNKSYSFMEQKTLKKERTGTDYEKKT